MATEHEQEFGAVSRVRGKVFEAVSFGSSVLGIVALAVLLVFVVVDAFGLAAADTGWILTYVAALVVPMLALWCYRLDDQWLVRRAGAALLVGAPAAFLLETALAAVGVSIPTLNWELLYLFAVVVPVTGTVLVTGRDGPVGGAANGLFGRILGGAVFAAGLVVVFEILDPQLWFLVYSLAVLPAVGCVAYARQNPTSILGRLRIPVGVLGLFAAVAIHRVFLITVPYWVFHVWALAVPVAVATAWLDDEPETDAGWMTTAGVTLLVLVVGSLAIGTQGIAASYGLLLLIGLVPAGRYAFDTAGTSPERIGLLAPLVLGIGIVIGTIVANALGIAGPDPWLDSGFLTNPPSGTASEAGFYPAIVGSVLVIAVVAVLSFAFGVGTAIFLEEYTADEGLVGSLTRLIQINIANLAAVPSVVYGLLGLALFANMLGFGLGTVVTAGLTLSLLILPITIISAQEALRAVPDDLRRGSDAMGATRWQTTRNVVVPEALPGIFTGTILALGRAIGETAPLLLIGAVTARTAAPSGVFDQVSAMPLQLFNWYGQPEPFPRGVVPAGVVTLLLVLLVMNGTAILLRNRYERSDG
ncbi:phosphate ABC transporter permease PstA [Salinarchaeum laminariae]|uniref:phosphate ABC transporter permease PstA n=1 Tax=Salinarchaeum laminariae TaxID=869888 RepID=UPI0020C02948|nr:phosphate ABC transporter permease PstA [Salinarchaeum laminariae]